MNRTGLPRAAVIASLSIAALNLALTFENAWPTPFPRPTMSISVELAVIVLIMAVAGRRAARLGWASIAALTAAVLLLVHGRYLHVTALGLFGRPVDLYWDLRHVPRVLEMSAGMVPGWLLSVGAAAVVLWNVILMLGLYAAARGLARGMAWRPIRAGAAGLAGVTLLAAAGWHAVSAPGGRSAFATPVVSAYLESMNDLAVELTGGDAAMARPHVDLPPSDLNGLGGRDVFVVFVESYGAVAIESGPDAPPVSVAIAGLDDELSADGWRAASAFVESPTVGGASWLAHASLLAGRTIDGHRAYEAMLARPTETLASRFAAAGYRTVGLFPGIRSDWPEGAAYRFDDVFVAADLDYAGPAFGRWAVPDQFSMDWLWRTAVEPTNRAPVFAMMATIMSHFPFAPVPPYQPDWDRLATAAPFDAAPTGGPAMADAGWAGLGASYAESIAYSLEWLGGFLQSRAPKDALVIVVGDHQPAAVVTGPGATRSVPVHVIARDPAALRPFLDGGFRPGLLPARPSLGPMRLLTVLILRGFDESS